MLVLQNIGFKIVFYSYFIYLLTNYKLVRCFGRLMFLFIIYNTSVSDVLPNGQRIKRCTSKDNADVTDQYKYKVASCESIVIRL